VEFVEPPWTVPLVNFSYTSMVYAQSSGELSLHIRIHLLLAFVAITALPGFSQDTMRANVRGNNRSDQGKCTIEVEVDDVAEVEVRGDTARIRSLSGGPSRFRRFDCDSLMPTRPNDFRFTGVDGRGRVTLVRDPRSGGAAVVRIEDPKSGREGYTFDLEWSGGNGYGGGRGNGSWGNNPRDDRDGYDQRNNDRGGYRGGRGNSYTITCSSDNGRRQYCQADVRGSVRLVRQFSRSACRQNDTWGYDSRGIWVDRGCGADFEVGR
jgi:hypothetical protein